MAAVGEFVTVAKINGSSEPIQYTSTPLVTISGSTITIAGLTVFKLDSNANFIIKFENLTNGTASSAGWRTTSDVADQVVSSHASSRVVSRFGITLGGWNEYLSFTGNGLVIGTLGAVPLVLGTNLLEAMRIDSTQNIITIGSITLGNATTGKLLVTAGQNMMLGAGTRNALRLAALTDPNGIELAATDSTGSVAYKPMSIVGTTAFLTESAGSKSIGINSSGVSINCNTFASHAGPMIFSLTSSTGTNQVEMRFINTGGTYYFGIENSAGSWFTATAYAMVIRAASGKNIEFMDNATIIGTINSTGLIVPGSITSKSSSGGIGYATGAGGGVTQATSKTTTVTLNKITGYIIMNNAALAAATLVQFTLFSTAFVSTDVIVVVHMQDGSRGSYDVQGHISTGGQALISVYNRTAGSLSEAIILRFVIIRSTNS